MSAAEEGIRPGHDAEMSSAMAADRLMVVELEDIQLTEGMLDLLMAFGEVADEPVTRLRRAA